VLSTDENDDKKLEYTSGAIVNEPESDTEESKEEEEDKK
jgi:hypothetical protein